MSLGPIAHEWSQDSDLGLQIYLTSMLWLFPRNPTPPTGGENVCAPGNWYAALTHLLQKKPCILLLLPLRATDFVTIHELSNKIFVIISEVTEVAPVHRHLEGLRTAMTAGRGSKFHLHLL